MRRASRAVVLALLLAVAACGGDTKGDRPDPFTGIDPRLGPVAGRAAPRWEPIAALTGSGPQTRTVRVSDRAIKWRARWRCASGSLTLSVAPRPRSLPSRSGGRCPARGSVSWVQTGSQRLRVGAPSRWRVVVEQQVDTPLREPPLNAMGLPRARVLATGNFHKIERRGSGEAKLYWLPGGRRALRLERFSTSANTDLFVWLSEARRPSSTTDVLHAPHIELARLKSTLGSQNYLLPPSIELGRVHSVAIWCEPIRIVYAAAVVSR